MDRGKGLVPRLVGALKVLKAESRPGERLGLGSSVLFKRRFRGRIELEEPLSETCDDVLASVLLLSAMVAILATCV